MLGKSNKMTPAVAVQKSSKPDDSCRENENQTARFSLLQSSSAHFFQFCQDEPWERELLPSSARTLTTILSLSENGQTKRQRGFVFCCVLQDRTAFLSVPSVISTFHGIVFLKLPSTSHLNYGCRPQVQSNLCFTDLAEQSNFFTNLTAVSYTNSCIFSLLHPEYLQMQPRICRILYGHLGQNIFSLRSTP